MAANIHQTTSRPNYNHQKSLSGSSNDLLRLATQNHGLKQQNFSEEPERSDQSANSPHSAYTSRSSLAPSHRTSWMDRESAYGRGGMTSESSASPLSQHTFRSRAIDSGDVTTIQKSPGSWIGESPRASLPKDKLRKGSSATSRSPHDASDDQPGHGFHGFWSSARPDASPHPAGDIDFGFTFPAGGPSHQQKTVNIQDLVRRPQQFTFLDLEDKSLRNGVHHTRSKTEPTLPKGLFLTRFFAGHRESSEDGISDLPKIRHQKRGHGKSASMSASPSISSPFGLSIAAYRPVPTHSTASRVSQSLSKPDLKSMDPSNSILLPAGPSHMQKQVEELETRRTTDMSRKHRDQNQREGVSSRDRVFATGAVNGFSPASRVGHSDLRPIAAISDAQVQRGGSDQPVHWMRTGLSRSASQEAVQLLQPTRWEARNGCEQLVLPRPKLVAHLVSPPATPEQVQRERAFESNRKGKKTDKACVDDVLVIDRQKHGVVFDLPRTSSPALSGIRVMDEGAERERERQEWARSVTSSRKGSVRRPRSNSVGASRRRQQAEHERFETEVPSFASKRSPSHGNRQAVPNPSPPISTSFGFLHTHGSLRSRSRSTTGSSRKTAGNSPQQSGSVSTDGQSFRNVPRDYGSIGRTSEDPFAVPLPRTPSRHENRLSRNHSSPDLRTAASRKPPWLQDHVGPDGDRLVDIGVPADEAAKNQRPTTPLWFGARTHDLLVQRSRESSHIPSESHSERLLDANEIRTRYLTLSEPPILGPELSLSPARTAPPYQTYSPARGTAGSPLAEPLPLHTARALASRLSNSPRRMKSSIEEAIDRARSSAMLLYGEDPESFAKADQAPLSAASEPRSTTPSDRREILKAAGILPQHVSRKYLTPVTEGNESARSTSSIGRSPGQDRMSRDDNDPSPVLIMPSQRNLNLQAASPAVSEASPWPRRPIDELDQYDQELFFAKPWMAWSSPLPYPAPGSATRFSATSPLDSSSHPDRGLAIANSRDRASKDSTISQMLSTPTTEEHYRVSQDGTENVMVEVATPMLAPGEYGWSPNAQEGLDTPFEMRLDAASPNALDRQPSHATLRKDFGHEPAPWTRDDNSLFQGSPYQTQTEDGTDGEFTFGRQNLVHKSSSEHTSLLVGTVPSATPAHRSPSMDQLTSGFKPGHTARASVVPEVVTAGSPSTLHPSQPSTPSVMQEPSRPFLPNAGSSSSLGSARSISRLVDQSVTPSPEGVTDLFRQPRGIASIVRDFPAPPSRSTSHPSTLSSVVPSQGDEDLATDDLQAMPPLKAGLLPPIPPIRRLETDNSAMTGNSYVTATEGYDTDDDL